MATAHTDLHGFGYYFEDTIRFLDGVVDERAQSIQRNVKAIILGDSSFKEHAPSDRACLSKPVEPLMKALDAFLEAVRN